MQDFPEETLSRKSVTAIAITFASLCWVSSGVRAADSGTVTLRCKGSAQHNEDIAGRDSNIKYESQEGAAVIDFSKRRFQFLDWGWVPFTRADSEQISAKLGNFEIDTNLANIELNRMTGEAYFQYWVHDHKRKLFWYRHIFAGKCEAACN